MEFIQNTPLASQVMFLLFSLVLGLRFRFLSSHLGLSGGIYHGAYISEVIRTGMRQALEGTIGGGSFPGDSLYQTMYHHIILPQTIKIIMPPLANQALNLVKNTSILAMVAGMDLMYFTDSY